MWEVQVKQSKEKKEKNEMSIVALHQKAET